jgi:diguanylate cyclase (GGDEF)-like protein/PAS domain S-box-containing protein
MNLAPRSENVNPYALAITGAGVGVCILSILQLSLGSSGLPFLLLALFTTASIDRASVQFPRIASYVPVSRTFTFLAILLFEPAAAVLMAFVEGLCSSSRITKKPLIVLFHGAAKALPMFVTVAVIRFAIEAAHDTSSPSYEYRYFIAFAVMGAVEQVAYSKILIGPLAFKSDSQFRPVRARLPRVDPIVGFMAAPLAGLVAMLIGTNGFFAIITVTPILAVILFVLLGNLIVMRQAQASTSEAEEARRCVVAIKESEELFRSAFDHAPIGMGLVSQAGRWLQVNSSLCEIVGYSESELLEMDFQSLTHPEDLYNFLCLFSEVANDKGPGYQVEKRYLHKLGHEVWVTANISLARDSQTGSLHIILQIQDITGRKRAEQRLLHDALHDPLTGLPNRAFLMDQLGASLEQAKRQTNQLFAVLFLDLDRFKVINDSIGHMVGDELLVGIAGRLKKCLRPGDLVARLGGDEFTILLRKIRSKREAIEVAERIQREVALPFDLGGYEAFTTASIGIALYDSSYERHEDILRDADSAMYHAKALGKARYALFHKGLHTHAMNLLHMETDMRRAIDRKEFFIEYQPIVSLQSGRLSGFEALVRWQHPERGVIAPGDFIPMAEEAGYIESIGRWVLSEACTQMRSWHRQFSTELPLSIAVNLSSKQFMNSNLIDHVVQTLDATGMDPRTLKLEITESGVMENVGIVSTILERLRNHGVELSIDDFGTGYSSLSYLHRLPINTLKIDRSFVNRLGEANENKEIVRTIIMLAKNLGMAVVAEGVETRKQLGRLRELNCESAQGFLFSKPLCAASAESLIERTIQWQWKRGGSEPVRQRRGLEEVVAAYASTGSARQSSLVC